MAWAAGGVRSTSLDEPLLRCVSALRGLSTDEDARRLVIKRGGLGPLLAIAKRSQLADAHAEAKAVADEAAAAAAEEEEEEKEEAELGGKGVVKKKKKKKAQAKKAKTRSWDWPLEMEAMTTLLNLSLTGAKQDVYFKETCKHAEERSDKY